MGIRKQYKVFLFLLFLCSFFLIDNSSFTIQAKENESLTIDMAKEEAESKENNDEEEHSDGVGNTNNGCEAYTNEKERKQCLEDRKASTKTADFYSEAIMSLDEDLRAQEKNEDYIKNFSNSSATAVAYDLWLVDPPTIIMHLVNTVTTIIEKIGSFVSLAVLILYNVASSSFWSTIMQEIFSVIDKALFDWDNENSWFFKLVILFGCIALAKKLMKSKKSAFTLRSFANAIFEVVLSCLLVVFVARYGRPLIIHTETLISDSIVETFSLEDSSGNTPIEIQNKRLIFNALQKQGFILRHFGVTDASQISNINSGDYREAAEGSEIPFTGEERVEKLLNEPSKDNAQFERQMLGSTDISYNVNQCLNILGLSIVFFVHRLLLGVVYGAGALLLLTIGFLKELLLAVSTYALVLMLLRENKGIAAKWFSSRVQWMILFILAHIVFSMMLFFTNQLVAKVTGYGLLMILPFDVILVLGMKYLYQNKEEIWKKLTADIDLDGEGAFHIAKGIISGDIAPKDVYENRSERKRQEAQEDGENEDGADGKLTKKSSTLQNFTDDQDLAERETDSEADGISDETTTSEGEDGTVNAEATDDTDATKTAENSETMENSETAEESKADLEESEALFEEMEASAQSKEAEESKRAQTALDGEDDLDESDSNGNQTNQEKTEDSTATTVSPELDEELSEVETNPYGDSNPDIDQKEHNNNSFQSDMDRFMDDLMQEDEKTVTPELEKKDKENDDEESIER